MNWLAVKVLQKEKFANSTCDSFYLGDTTYYSTFRLSDEDDFLVFLAMAEDQYRLLPAKPLNVMLVVPGEFRPTPPYSTPSPEPPTSYKYRAKMDGFIKSMEAVCNLCIFLYITFRGSFFLLIMVTVNKFIRYIVSYQPTS